MREVTSKIQDIDTDLLKQLERAVRTLHGSPDPDLEQEAFLKTIQALRRNNDIRHPRAFIWKVVRDTVADHWRRRRRDDWESLAGVPERRLASKPELEVELDRQRVRARLREAILDLGCGIRGPVYLYYVEQYSVETITRIYGKSPSAVKMALLRGRRRLTRMFPAPRDI